MDDDQITDTRFLEDQAQNLPVELQVTLEVLEGSDKGKQLPVTRYSTSIGRRKTDIILNDTSASRKHAEIRYEAGKFIIEDLQSSNGTFINGKRIDKRQLIDRDHLKIGDTVLVFQLNKIQPPRENDTDPSLALPTQEREGERKFVSIVFADISGFSGLAEKMDPEELTSMMNGCFERLIKIAYKHQGTVDKLIGDCIMVLFGAPLAHEDDTDRALSCSLEMIHAVEQYGERIGKPLKVSIGVNAGTVLAGTVGSELKRDYTVMGNAVNIAQKLQKQARPGEVRVTDAVANLTAKNFQFEKLAQFEVRGISTPIEQYLLLGLKKLESFALTSNITHQIVGRKEELNEIKSWCDKALNGKMVSGVITGESGVGKSRLAKEVYLYALTKGLRPYRIVARSINHHVSYAFIQELIFALLETDLHQEKIDYDEVFSQILSHGLNEDEAKFVVEIFPEQHQSGRHSDLPVHAKLEAITFAVSKLLANLINAAPTFIQFDSLQWVDPLSLNLLKRTFIKLQGKVFLLSICRESKNLPWTADLYLSLKPLNRQDGNILAEKLLGSAAKVSGSLVETVYERSGGNPLYIEELCSILHQQPSALGIDLRDPSTVSASLTSVLQARIDRLTPKSKEILQYAATMGNEFDPRLLVRIVGDENHTRIALQDLIESGLIEQLEEFQTLIYTFHNPLLREVTLNSLLKEKQRKISKKVATEMERALVGQNDTKMVGYAMLGEYFELANQPLKAIDYFAKAAENVADHGDYQSAIRLYQRATVLLKLNFNDQPELLAKLVIKTAQLTALSQSFHDAVHLLDQVIISIESATLPSQKKYLFSALKEKARCKRLIGELREATQILQKVLSDPHATEETELFIETLRELGVIHFQHGEYDLALNYYHQALQRAKAHQDFLLIAHCLNEIGLVHYYKGQLGTALNFYLESLDLREKSGNQRAIAVVLPNIADAYNKLGEQTKALQHLQKSIEIARKIGDRRLLVISLHNHGDILAEQNQYQQATQQFQHSLQIADELGFTDAANLNRIQLALMQTLTKPEPQHLKQLEQLLKEAEQLENIENQIHANLALAITYHRHKNFEKSKQLFSEALLNAEKIASSHLQQLIKNRMLQFPIRND